MRKCKEHEMEKSEIRKGIPIYLNIYNISGINYFFQTFGLGIYHTGIEIFEREYSFGSTDRDYSGVIAIRPGSLGFAVKEKIYLGNTLFTPDEIRYLAYLISYVWRGLTYDPFSKNCNFFTKFFAECLLRSSVNYPNYINRFTKFKTLFHCFYKPFKNLIGDIVQMKPESTSSKEQEKSKPVEEPLVEKKNNKEIESVTVSSHNDTSKEHLKNKKKRKTQRSRINRRIKRYKIKELKNKENNLIEPNLDKGINPSEETHLLTSRTRIVSHNDFFRNFNQNILSKFEANLLIDNFPLRASPRLFLDDNEGNIYLKEVSNLSDFTINPSNYENFEEIVNSINRKAQEKQFSLHKRKLFFLNNLVKYMKIALKLSCVDKNYERAIMIYKYCVEIIDELLFSSSSKTKHSTNKGSKSTVTKNYERDLIDNEQRLINENSINIEFTQEDIREYSYFYDNKEFLITTLIKVYHSIIYCNQKLYLFNEIIYYCDKILSIDSKDWVARLKRGLYYYFSQDFLKADSDFKVALDGCPYKEQLKYELDKLS